MKKILLTLLLLPSISWACPDLQGEYLCSGDEGQETVSMKQEMRNGAMYYYDANEPDSGILTDGVLRKLPDDQFTRNQTAKAYCDGEVVKMEYTGEFYQGDETVGRGVMRAEIKKSGTDMVMQSTYTLSMPEEPDHVEVSNTTCTRL